MKPRFLKSGNWSVLLSSVILLAIGMVALFSASKNTDYEEFQKQIIWFIISIPILIITVFFDYRKIIKFAYSVYLIILIALVAVLFTTPVNGATSWFNIGGFTLQPSEFAKVVMVLCMAKLIANIQKNDNSNINKIRQLFKVIILIGIPILLIIKQPDYGTATAFIIALIFILFASGISKKYIFITLLIVAVSLPLLYFFVLPSHAKSRIDIFLDPYKDPRGAGYNIIQSKLAIGSGELLGMGILKGNQTQLRLFVSKDNRFYFCSNRRRNGIYCC